MTGPDGKVSLDDKQKMRIGGIEKSMFV